MGGLALHSGGSSARARYLVDGALGIILASLSGMVVLKAFGRLDLPTKPWQALVVALLPAISRLCFMMVFLAPIADYLWLPSGHTPNTLMKYLSIVVVRPENLFATRFSDYFPGFPILVILSAVLMFWGSLKLEDGRHLLYAFLGILLYTLSPTITYSVLSGSLSLRFIWEFYAIGFWLAWIGLILFMTSKILPRFLSDVKSTSTKTDGVRLMSVSPIFLGAFYLIGNILNVEIPRFVSELDFESSHHFVSGIFSGVTAGAGSATIVGVIPASSATSETVAPGEEQPETPTEDDDTVSVTQNPDGTNITKLPNGGSITLYPDGRVTETKPDGSAMTWGPKGDVIGKTFGEGSDLEGVTVTINPDGTMVATSPYGGSMKYDAKGELVGGTITTKDGYIITVKEDGTLIGTDERGTATVYPDGRMEAVLKDGSKITVDQDGRLSGHINLDNGASADISPDNKIVIRDAQGNTVTMNPDGTYDYTGVNGEKESMNPSDGSYSYSAPNGTSLTMTGDKLTIRMPDGSNAEAHTDGSMTVTGSDGKVTNYTAEQLKNMSKEDITKQVQKDLSGKKNG